MELDQDFSAGEAYEAAVQSLVDRGFAVTRAVAAMRKAQGHREIALGLLETTTAADICFVPGLPSTSLIKRDFFSKFTFLSTHWLESRKS